VLVVEDNDDAREMLVTLLRIDGHEVFEAADGEAGLEALLELRPDVAFIDVGLPKLSGFEVAERARAANVDRSMLVAITGYALAEDRRRAEAAGFDIHLAKPVDPRAILEILEREPGERRAP
jgi:CheY-like chemotaxis protein